MGKVGYASTIEIQRLLTELEARLAALEKPPKKSKKDEDDDDG